MNRRPSFALGQHFSRLAAGFAIERFYGPFDGAFGFTRVVGLDLDFPNARQGGFDLRFDDANFGLDDSLTGQCRSRPHGGFDTRHDRLRVKTAIGGGADNSSGVATGQDARALERNRRIGAGRGDLFHGNRRHRLGNGFVFDDERSHDRLHLGTADACSLTDDLFDRERAFVVFDRFGRDDISRQFVRFRLCFGFNYLRRRLFDRPGRHNLNRFGNNGLRFHRRRGLDFHRGHRFGRARRRGRWGGCSGDRWTRRKQCIAPQADHGFAGFLFDLADTIFELQPVLRNLASRQRGWIARN